MRRASVCAVLVRDVMTKDLLAVAPDTGLSSCAELFAKHEISGAPVVRPDGSVCGVISVSEISQRHEDTRARAGYSVFYRLVDGVPVEQGSDTEDSAGRVEDVMSTELLSINADADLKEAGAKMLEHHVHRILVVEDGKCVGIVSTLDLIRAHQN